MLWAEEPTPWGTVPWTLCSHRDTCRLSHSRVLAMALGSQNCASAPIAQGRWTYQTVFGGPWVQPPELSQVFKEKRRILVNLLYLVWCTDLSRWQRR